MKSLLRSLAAACALVVMATSGALAEWKPSGPITMMIAFAAGGGADTQARMIAEELEKRHGWKIIPEQARAVSARATNGTSCRPAPAFSFRFAPYGQGRQR
jgi:ABC-type glycerol-3-phosphate transport system substrate-binding protein